MADGPGESDETVVCPACDSVSIERAGPDQRGYRCLDCSSEFDDSGGPTIVD
jgi:transposase-like protein